MSVSQSPTLAKARGLRPAARPSRSTWRACAERTGMTGHSRQSSGRSRESGSTVGLAGGTGAVVAASVAACPGVGEAVSSKTGVGVAGRAVGGAAVNDGATREGRVEGGSPGGDGSDVQPARKRIEIHKKNKALFAAFFGFDPKTNSAFLCLCGEILIL